MIGRFYDTKYNMYVYSYFILNLSFLTFIPQLDEIRDCQKETYQVDCVSCSSRS